MMFRNKSLLWWHCYQNVTVYAGTTVVWGSSTSVKINFTGDLWNINLTKTHKKKYLKYHLGLCINLISLSHVIRGFNVKIPFYWPLILGGCQNNWLTTVKFDQLVLAEPGFIIFFKYCRSRTDGFFCLPSSLWICLLFNSWLCSKVCISNLVGWLPPDHVSNK